MCYAPTMTQQEIDQYPLFKGIPLSALHVSCRRKLAMALNQDMLLPSSSGFARNWEGLVEAIGFPYTMIKVLRNRDDPTMSLLDIWENDESDPTFATLLEFLEIIERFDAIADVMPLLERDATAFNNREEEKKRRNTAVSPIQDPCVSSGPTLQSATRQIGVEYHVDRSGKDDTYDAYVAYAMADTSFVLSLVEKLEKEYRLKLFLKDRDMLPGEVESEAELRMIHERCERILLIISPEFLNDPHCEFQTIFAQALAVDNNLYARKIIPVIYKQCQLPVRLKFIARVDYTKKDFFSKFWDRLYNSIKNPPQAEFPFPASNRSPLLTRSQPTLHSEEYLTSGNSLSPPVAVNCSEHAPCVTNATSNFESITLSTLNTNSSTENLRSVSPSILSNGGSATDDNHCVPSPSVRSKASKSQSKKTLKERTTKTFPFFKK